MAYTINLDDDCVSAEELQLMKTKQAILDKLRVRFGEFAKHDGWAAQRPIENEAARHHSKHPR